MASEQSFPGDRARSPHHRLGWHSVPFQKWTGGQTESGEDALVIEEPIEYRIRGQSVATVMRTPGNDRDLAMGFFFSEGWIAGSGDVGALCLGSGEREGGTGAFSVVDLLPSEGTDISIEVPPRGGPVFSSCGVCGKRSIEEVLRTVTDTAVTSPGDLAVSPEMVFRLPRELRRQQPLFERTGALHAAGIFDGRGRSLVVREDIGRHNAVDKVIGSRVLRGEVPLREHILVVSGRASFEIVQKALRAGIPMVVAVSGVSQLAVELARQGGVTLCGFARQDSFSTYSCRQRIASRTR